jgi:phenylalanyl-tRNA synthetase beta chain
MPTIAYDKTDLIRLIGKEMSDEELKEIIESIKPSVEKIRENEIVLEHPADRIDLFGIEGLARAIRQYTGIKPGLCKYKVKRSGLVIKVDSVPVRPFIGCAIVKGLKLDDPFIKSLMNIQEILHETIGRKRRKVAIGIHDFDKIKPPIRYAGVSREEKMIPLGCTEEMSLKEVLEKTEKGKEYGFLIQEGKLWPVFIDSLSIFSFPPIINSERTRVTEKTKNLFIDVTGTDKLAVLQVLNILVTNLAERGCKLESVRIRYKKKVEETPDLTEKVLEVSKNVVNKLLGLELEGKEIVKLLKRMGYDSIEYSDKLEVIVPAYRVDVSQPVDIVEDIAIAYGYNNFELLEPKISTIGKADELEKFSTRVRNLMVGFGLLEVVRTVLTNQEEQFDKMEVERKNVVEVENPVSKEYTCLRVWLLPSLLKVLSANKHVEYPQKLFEVGDVVLPAEGETMSKTVRKLCVAISHSAAGFAEIKSVAENFLTSLNVQYSLKMLDHPTFIKGRACEIYVKDKPVGFFGEIHPKVLENWKLEMPVAAFEADLESLLS